MNATRVAYPAMEAYTLYKIFVNISTYKYNTTPTFMRECTSILSGYPRSKLLTL